MDQAQSLENCASICSFCSRMKRGRIYACARKNGYNVLALGQHLDDLCERYQKRILVGIILKNILYPFVSKNTSNFSEIKNIKY